MAEMMVSMAMANPKATAMTKAEALMSVSALFEEITAVIDSTAEALGVAMSAENAARSALAASASQTLTARNRHTDASARSKAVSTALEGLAIGRLTPEDAVRQATWALSGPSPVIVGETPPDDGEDGGPVEHGEGPVAR